MPGADELFRPTGGGGGIAGGPGLSTVGSAALRTGADRLRAVPDPVEVEEESESFDAAGYDEARPQEAAARPARVRAATRPQGGSTRGASGRERHEEKITVYVSPEELLGLEQARIMLRAEHGLAVDRGRIVREALDLMLADFDANGDASMLVRSLRGG
jgi:hypothetical protein